MDDLEVIKHKVVYLLSIGWGSLEAIQENLGISNDDMPHIIKWLIDENYITLYTIH